MTRAATTTFKIAGEIAAWAALTASITLIIILTVGPAKF